MSKTKFSLTAIIYDKRGRVLSIGKNSYTKTHPLQSKHAEAVGLPHKQFIHAEIHAIVKCARLDKAHRIVVYRYDKSGREVSAKPCKVCMSAIQSAGIPFIEYT